MIPKIIVQYSNKSDAQNWIRSLNNSNSQWRNLVPKEHFTYLKTLFSKNKDYNKELRNFITNTYDRTVIANNIKTIQDLLDKNIHYIVQRLEKMTEKPFEYGIITVQGTTFPRCPYNWENGFLRTFVLTNNSQLVLRNVAHELLHFQFHKYYNKYGKTKSLDENQFYVLKESLTFLINLEFPKLDLAEDKGYSHHQQIREKLKKFWLNNNNFSDLIDYGYTIVSGSHDSNFDQQ